MNKQNKYKTFYYKFSSLFSNLLIFLSPLLLISYIHNNTNSKNYRERIISKSIHCILPQDMAILVQIYYKSIWRIISNLLK